MPRVSMVESDVVFMYPAHDAESYRAYGATLVAWGGAFASRERVEQLHALGVRVAGSVWCLTAGGQVLKARPELAQAVVRDIAGAPLEVPWLPEGRTKGSPTWWGCFHHPLFSEHVRQTVRKAMAGGADGLHVDDHLGTAHPAMEYGGCFCDFCMADFRAYLQTRDIASARRPGLTAPDGFDYRDWVRREATTRERYLEIQDRIPLHRAFVDFHLHAAAEHVRELHVLAESVAGHPVTLSANTALPQAPHLRVTPHLTYLVGEVDHRAEEGLAHTGTAVVACRLADAVGKPLAATARGADWAHVKARSTENLVCYWIAQMQACGHHLMTPAQAWCYTPDLGTDYYHGRTEAYAPLYRFIRRNGALLDGYRAIGAQVLVLYRPSHDFHGDGRTLAVMERLAAANIPFDVAILPNAWGVAGRDDPLAACRRYRHVIVDAGADEAEPMEAAGQLEAVLSEHPGVIRLDADKEAPWRVNLAADAWALDRPKVWAFPRAGADGPAAIHLLNRDYDAGADTFAPQRDIALFLRRGPVGGGLGEARWHHPGSEPVRLAVAETGEGVRIVVPELTLWGIVEVDWRPPLHPAPPV